MALKYTIDTLINSIVNKDVFEKIQGKKILIYDLNPRSKEMMEWFFRHDVYVTGFLLEDERRDYADIRYFNKRMFYFDELQGDELILDAFGENVESIKNRTDCEICKLYNPENAAVIIYGAGIRGGYCFNNF